MESLEVLIGILIGASMILLVFICLWNCGQVRILKKEMAQVKNTLSSERKDMSRQVQDGDRVPEGQDTAIIRSEEQTAMEKEALINEVLSEVFG